MNGRPHGPRDLDRMSPRDLESYDRALQAVSKARGRLDRRITPAARASHTTVANVRRWLPEVLRRDAFGAIVASDADRAFRPLQVIERGGGIVDVSTRGSRVASAASTYAHTVDLYRAGLVGPDAFELFEGKRIGGVELETDADRIDELDATGRLDDFEFYQDLP